MKKYFKLEMCLMAVCALFLLSNCKKVKDIPKTPNLDTTLFNAKYPATVSFYQGGRSNYPTVNTYTYDKDNHLIKFGNDNLFSNIGTNQVDQTFNEYGTNNSGQTAVIRATTTSYIYTLAGLPNTSVNIYNTAPTQVNYTYYDKNMLSGVTSSRPGGVSQFFVNSDGLPTKVLDNTNNVTYTYDAKKNLTKLEYVSLSGPRAGALFSRVNFLSFDDKSSPFSAVKGYWPASYPQSYPWEFALAFCKNNPKQTTTEQFDVNKNAFVLYETDDYSYVYNEKGYPTQITINITYYTAVTTHFVYTYNYTYK